MHTAPATLTPGSQRDRASHFPWYDSVWLSAYEDARRILGETQPAALTAFEQAFASLRTRADFRPLIVDPVFPPDVLDGIRASVRALRPDQIELHEARLFRRFIVHNHPEFTKLQHGLVERVSALAGEPLEVSYNFLSLYGPSSSCALHMDSPQAKWTLDLCLNQSAPWPIHFSRIVPWPTLDDAPQDSQWPTRLRADPAMAFESHALAPGQALLFSGSSQWHVRDPIPAAAGRAHCDLLFFHFIPAGTATLLRPETWAERFGLPQLAHLRS